MRNEAIRFMLSVAAAAAAAAAAATRIEAVVVAMSPREPRANAESTPIPPLRDECDIDRPNGSGYTIRQQQQQQRRTIRYRKDTVIARRHEQHVNYRTLYTYPGAQGVNGVRCKTTDSSVVELQKK